MRTLRFCVSEGEGGERLDIFISRGAGLSRSRAQRLISEGAVRVGGEVRPKHHRLRAGDRVEVDEPPREEAPPMPQDIPLDIVYEDSDLAVIEKPAGLVVHPAGGHREGTLVNALLHGLGELSSLGDAARPGIVHRLDRDTSGLLVVAKNDPSHLRLQKMVRDRTLQRHYLALVHGVPPTRLGTVEAPVGRDPKERKRMAVTASGGRPAVTHFRVERSFAACALLEVELVTGRTHQIRVHLSYIGHPVAGDRQYGTRGSLERELGLQRQFLHACRLIFPHPSSGETLRFESPLPPDLEGPLRMLAGE